MHPRHARRRQSARTAKEDGGAAGTRQLDVAHSPVERGRARDVDAHARRRRPLDRLGDADVRAGLFRVEILDDENAVMRRAAGTARFKRLAGFDPSIARRRRRRARQRHLAARRNDVGTRRHDDFRISI